MTARPVVRRSGCAPTSLATTSDGLTFTTGSGEHYTATFGSPKVPVVGDPTGAMVSLKRVSDTVIEKPIMPTARR